VDMKKHVHAHTHFFLRIFVDSFLFKGPQAIYITKLFLSFMIPHIHPVRHFLIKQRGYRKKKMFEDEIDRDKLRG
jgi:hypothetical protein